SLYLCPDYFYWWDGSEVTASLNNPTSGWTKVTDTTNDMNNSTASNSTSGDFTSSMTLPNASMSSFAGTGVTGFTPMLNTNATPMFSPESSGQNIGANNNGGEKANLRKLEANVPNDADYDVWLPLALVHMVNDKMKNSLYDRVTKNTNVVEEVYDHGTNDGIMEATVGQASLTKGVIPTCSTLVVGEQVRNESVRNKFPSSYATKLSPTFSTKANLQKLKVNVPIDADYDVWLPLASVHEINDRMKNLLYGYFISKRLAFPVVEWFVRNNWEKYGFQKVKLTIVKKKKSKTGSSDGDNKKLKPVPVKPKTHYHPKAKQSTEGTSNSPKKTPFVGMNNASTSCYNKESPSKKANGFCSISYSFVALNVENVDIEKVAIEGKLMFVYDDETPFEKVDFFGKTESEDEVEPVDNETGSYLASKPMGVGYGLKSLQGIDTAYLLLYVDDIVLPTSFETLLQQIIASLHQMFSMTDLSVEVEYRGVTNAITETCWLRNLLRELHTPLSSATRVYCDHVSVVYLSYNPVHHQRTKHIEIDIYFVRDLVAVG
ncbi:ribonuclease H-like domain-containing protein, partial [Tanacetum coccineum]